MTPCNVGERSSLYKAMATPAIAMTAAAMLPMFFGAAPPVDWVAEPEPVALAAEPTADPPLAAEADPDEPESEPELEVAVAKEVEPAAVVLMAVVLVQEQDESK